MAIGQRVRVPAAAASAANWHQSRDFDELCAAVLGLLKPVLCAPAISDGGGDGRTTPQVTPAAIASLMLGASTAMMLCGSVTFVIGLILLPWVLALVMALYLVGVVSSLSVLGRALICPAAASSSPKAYPVVNDIAGQQFTSKAPFIWCSSIE